MSWSRLNDVYLSCCSPEFGLALLVEAVDEAVGLALQRPPQGDAAPAAQLLRVPDERLHRLRETHELGRAQTLQRAVLLETETTRDVTSHLHFTLVNERFQLIKLIQRVHTETRTSTACSPTERVTLNRHNWREPFL